MPHDSFSRRAALGALLGGVALAMAPRGAGAQAGLAPTPAQTPGPYYPARFPADVDSDLTRISGRAGAAAGTPLRLTGQVLDTAGRPVPGAVVELWQCDANGRYHHVDDGGSRPRDPNFQGYGRTRTDGSGAYAFRTVRPAAYEGRAPHIHIAVGAPGRRRLFTQAYLAGDPANARDGILNAVRDPRGRASLIVALRPQDDGLAGTFDIVLAG